MQNTSAIRECLRVFDLRTVLHVPSRSSIRLSKPVRGSPTTTPSRRTPPGTAHRHASSHNRVWKASSAPTAVIPTVPISPDLAGSQPSRQAPPGWIGHKLRFIAFHWYSALLKGAQAAWTSAHRTRSLPHERRSCAQKSAGASLPRRDLSKGNSTKPRRYAARVNWSQNESLSLVRYIYVVALRTTRRGNMPSGATSRSACDLRLAAPMESPV